MNSQRAFLSNESNYTVFRVGDKVIRFRAPYSLEHYTEVKEWNHGSVCQKTSTLPYRKCRGEYCSPVFIHLYPYFRLMAVARFRYPELQPKEFRHLPQAIER